MKTRFLTVAKVSLVLVYFVIIAGALVRMTGSGMGCPDWPKCFGYYIPPTDVEELTWRPQRSFEKGQVIIKDDALLVAASDFTTTQTFDPQQWRPYTKHDYAIFNPTHTWIEYLNRLCGALAGLAVVFMAWKSRVFWKTRKKVVWLSWLVVLMMGFQAWLGATVVYSVLNPIKITVHMVVALVIVAAILYIIRLASPANLPSKRDALFSGLLWASLLLTLIQVILGTQVRQFVDHHVKLTGYDQMHLILHDPEWDFYVHRTLSILVLLFNGWLFIWNKNKQLGYAKINWVMAMILLEILTGVAMYYLDFPFGTQAAHLVLASVLFGMQFYLILEAKRDIE